MTTAKRRRSGDHVVLIDNGFRCTHCGDEYVMNMPCSLTVYSAAARAYLQDHRRCKARPAGERT